MANSSVGNLAVLMSADSSSMFQTMQSAATKMAGVVKGPIASAIGGGFSGLTGIISDLGQGQIGSAVNAAIAPLKGLTSEIAKMGPYGQVIAAVADSFLAVAGAAAQAVDQVTAFVRGQAQSVVALANQANLFRVSTDSLAALQLGAIRAGLSLEDVTHAMGHMVRTIGAAVDGSEEAGAALRRLGLSSFQLVDMNAIEQWDAVAARLREVSNVNERNRLAHTLMGRQGQSMLNYLDQDPAQQAGDQSMMARIGYSPGAMEAASREVMGAFGRLSTLGKAFELQLAGGLMPTVKAFINAMFDAGAAVAPVWSALVKLTGVALSPLVFVFEQVSKTMADLQPLFDRVAAIVAQIGPAFQGAFDPQSLQFLKDVLGFFIDSMLRGMVLWLGIIANAVVQTFRGLGMWLNLGIDLWRTMSAIMAGVGAAMAPIFTLGQSLVSSIFTPIRDITEWIRTNIFGWGEAAGPTLNVLQQIAQAFRGLGNVILTVLRTLIEAVWIMFIRLYNALAPMGNMPGISQLMEAIDGINGALNEAGLRVDALQTQLMTVPVAAQSSLREWANGVMEMWAQLEGQENDYYTRSQRLFNMVRNMPAPGRPAALEAGSTGAVEAISQFNADIGPGSTQEQIQANTQAAVDLHQAQLRVAEDIRAGIERLLREGAVTNLAGI